MLRGFPLSYPRACPTLGLLPDSPEIWFAQEADRSDLALHRALAQALAGPGLSKTATPPIPVFGLGNHVVFQIRVTPTRSASTLQGVPKNILPHLAGPSTAGLRRQSSTMLRHCLRYGDPSSVQLRRSNFCAIRDKLFFGTPSDKRDRPKTPGNLNETSPFSPWEKDRMRGEYAGIISLNPIRIEWVKGACFKTGKHYGGINRFINADAGIASSVPRSLSTTK